MDALGKLGLQLVRVSQPSNALGYCTLLLKTGTEGVSRSAHRKKLFIYDRKNWAAPEPLHET